eukprot:1622330-Karenia_brevis.AAC.1
MEVEHVPQVTHTNLVRYPCGAETHAVVCQYGGWQSSAGHSYPLQGLTAVMQRQRCYGAVVNESIQPWRKKVA